MLSGEVPAGQASIFRGQMFKSMKIIFFYSVHHYCVTISQNTLSDRDYNTHWTQVLFQAHCLFKETLSSITHAKCCHCPPDTRAHVSTAFGNTVFQGQLGIPFEVYRRYPLSDAILFSNPSLKHFC